MKIILFALLISSFFMPGCSKQTSPQEEQEAAVSDITADFDKYQGKPVGTHDLPLTIQGVGGDINLYESISELTDDSDIVVYAEITNYGFVDHVHEIKTVEVAKVIEPLYGSISEGTEISIVKTGGYIPLDVYFQKHPGYEDKTDRYGKKIGTYTSEELKTKYIGNMPEGYFSPEIGGRALFFLSKAEWFDGYQITGTCVFGEYDETAEGLFRKPSFENDLSASSLVAEIPVFTYEELKEEISSAGQSDSSS